MREDDVIVLRKYVSEVEATMAHLVLEAHNIPSAVMRDTAGGMIPSMAILYPVRLAVRREDADEARRILDSEAPLPAEDGGGEAIEEPNDFAARWSPERDRDDDGDDEEPDDGESDRRW
jgi:putative signal transducing protein